VLRTQIPKGMYIADEIVLRDAKSRPSCRVSAAPSWCPIKGTNTRSSALADATARSLELQRNSLRFGTICQRVMRSRKIGRKRAALLHRVAITSI